MRVDFDPIDTERARNFRAEVGVNECEFVALSLRKHVWRLTRENFDAITWYDDTTFVATAHTLDELYGAIESILTHTVPRHFTLRRT